MGNDDYGKYDSCDKPLGANRGMAPVEFARLLDTMITDVSLRAAIDRLLALKRVSGELGKGPAIPEIDASLALGITRLAEVASTLPPNAKSDSSGMDDLLRRTICGL